MKVLTLWCPWSWAIFHMPDGVRKLVENRDWPPPQHVRGQRIAIHAGKTFDKDGAAWIEETFGVRVPPPEDHPRGIIGTVRVAGMRDHSGAIWWRKPSEGEPSFVTLKRGAPLPPGTHDGGKWFVGACGWLLDEPIALPTPIGCKGAQGLWDAPPAALIQILSCEAAARARSAPALRDAR